MLKIDNKKGGIKSTDKQILLIKYYFECDTLQEASKKAGISNVTASRYFAKPEFKKKLNEYQEQLTERNIKGLQNLLGKANKTLSKILEDGSNNQKLQACKIIYDNAFKGLEITELKKRLDVLELSYSELEN